MLERYEVSDANSVSPDSGRHAGLWLCHITLGSEEAMDNERCGPYTGSEKKNSRQFYSDYYMLDTSPRAVGKITCLVITTPVRSRFS